MHETTILCSSLSFVSTPTIRGSILPALMSATPTSSSTTFSFSSSASASAVGLPPVPSWPSSDGSTGSARPARLGRRRRRRGRRAGAGAGPSPGFGPPSDGCGSKPSPGSSDPSVRAAASSPESASPASSGASGAAPPRAVPRPCRPPRPRASSRRRRRRPPPRAPRPPPRATPAAPRPPSLPRRPAPPALPRPAPPPARCRRRGGRPAPRRRGRLRLVGRDRRPRVAVPARERPAAGQRRQVDPAQHVADRRRHVLEVRHDVLGELVQPHALHGGGHHHAGQARARLADVERVHRLARAQPHLLGEALEPRLAARARRVAAEAVAERRVREQPLDQLRGDLRLGGGHGSFSHAAHPLE